VKARTESRQGWIVEVEYGMLNQRERDRIRDLLREVVSGFDLEPADHPREVLETRLVCRLFRVFWPIKRDHGVNIRRVIVNDVHAPLPDLEQSGKKESTRGGVKW